jgi:hypothetical protein
MVNKPMKTLPTVALVQTILDGLRKKIAELGYADGKNVPVTVIPMCKQGDSLNTEMTPLEDRK